MDLTESIAPKSDQLDAVDLVSGPRTFTIERVSRGNAEQPFNFHLAEFPRVWRPGKSMRRVLVAAWGPDATKYAGQRVTLYCDPSVMFGGEAVGGTRISHMSGIDKPLKVPLLIKRGQSATFTVQPLPDLPAPTPVPMASPAQIGQLVAALNAAGYATAPEKTAAIAEQLGSPRKPTEMTAEEADVLIQAFEAKAVGDGGE
ncbi:hypothetical protein SPF06_00880 [Sinomonas sp. JGH33]|uniref:Uncharacterized protein n=1 Tax=Sinomonas terricola TaxID=3110330 RepID=A0ABU5T0T7_9MICC|nr:hypothetical protein [Sinomonas sp. JGH33]MEA5453264.1 hypothetical protein [Sinomonas sp. JGH33]